jgi:hypothetical protein
MWSTPSFLSKDGRFKWTNPPWKKKKRTGVKDVQSHLSGMEPDCQGKPRDGNMSGGLQWENQYPNGSICHWLIIPQNPFHNGHPSDFVSAAVGITLSGLRGATNVYQRPSWMAGVSSSAIALSCWNDGQSCLIHFCCEDNAWSTPSKWLSLKKFAQRSLRKFEAIYWWPPVLSRPVVQRNSVDARRAFVHLCILWSSYGVVMERVWVSDARPVTNAW